jgi:hypothetical protein
MSTLSEINKCSLLTPVAKVIKKTHRVRTMTVGFVTPYLMAISAKPGAIIELAKGGTNVYIDTYRRRVTVNVHP